MFKKVLDEKSKRELKKKEEEEKQIEADLIEKVETEAIVETSKLTIWNFQTEYQKLYIANDRLEKDLKQLSNIMELQYNLQKLINKGLKNKHPNAFEFKDKENNAEFERNEADIEMSQLREEMNRAGKECIEQEQVRNPCVYSRPSDRVWP